MAVKEEKYDPGYEAAYGGAYGANPCNGEPCSFSSNGLSMSPPYVCSLKDLLLSGLRGRGSSFKKSKLLKNGNYYIEIWLVIRRENVMVIYMFTQTYSSFIFKSLTTVSHLRCIFLLG